jgi:tetratricopeptide (TPR) repeat protein
MAGFQQFSREANRVALSLFAKAIELDANYAAAYGMSARCYLQRVGFGWSSDREQEKAETRRLAHIAINLGRDDPLALCNAGFSLVIVAGDLEDGLAAIERSLALNPNLAWAWHFGALAKAFGGEPEAAVEYAARAMRLSPQDPQMFGMRIATAHGHFFAGRYAEAMSWAEDAVREQPNFFIGLCVMSAGAALAGRQAEAEKAMARLRELNPSLRMSNLKDLLPILRPEDFERWAGGMRKAGLPD